MVLKLLIQILVSIALLALEQVLGIPMLFFAVVLWFSHGQSSWGRQVLLFVGGMALSMVYHTPLISGWILLLVLAWLWQYSQRWLKSDALRLVLWSIAGSIVVAVVSGFHWTPASLISVSISLALTGIFAQVTFFVGSSTGKNRFQPSLHVVRTTSTVSK